MKKSLLFVLLVVGGSTLCVAQNPLVKQWDYRYGGTSYDFLYSLQQTQDQGYMLGGYSQSGIGGDKTQSSFGWRDYWIVKLDTLGQYQWDKSFGSTDDDFFTSSQQTRDGGYILGGYTGSGIGGIKTQPCLGGYDYWIVKIDSLGNHQWNKDIGGTKYDYLYSIQQTRDGGYIMGGWSLSDSSGNKTQKSFGLNDYWVVKVDLLGNKQWDKDYGGTADDKLYSLQQTNDGGYILGGYSYSGIGGNKTQVSQGLGDYWIIKIDSLGNKQWDKDFGGTGTDWLFSLQQTHDGGYIVAGASNSGIGVDKTQASNGGFDYWIIKLDSSGSKKWDRDFGSSLDEELNYIIETSDRGFLVSGDSYSNMGSDKTENNLGLEQIWVVKTDSLGTRQWDKTLLTTGHDEQGLAIQSKDGCYVIANYTLAGIGGNKTQPGQGSEDYWIIKFCDSTQSVLPKAIFVSSDSVFCGESGSCIDFFDHSVNNPTSWKWFFPGAVPDTSTQQNPMNICYSTPGTYAVKLIVINSNGSDSLTVSPMITFATSAAPPIITFSNDTIYCSHATAYQWYLNGLPIAGATDSFYVAASDGVYAVLITDGNGCTRLSDGFPVSMNELSGVGGVRIYPNPASNELWVESYGLLVNSRATLKISNVLGKNVYRTQLITQNPQPTTRIDISSLAKGVYIVEVSSGEKVFRAKFVKE